MARDIENVNITLPGESDTIELIVNGEPTEVVIALDSWASAVHADDADTVSGHTVARDVLADEYTNSQIDSMVETAGTVKTVNEVQPDQNGNVQISKADLGLGNVDNTSDADKPISAAAQAALDLKVDKVSGKGLSTNDYTDADKTKLGDLPTDAEITAALAGKVDKETGKGLSTNDFTDAEKTKLAGIEAGAQVNTITGVKGDAEAEYRTGDVNITKANIGLGNVDNTADQDKPISTAVQEALDLKQDTLTFDNVPTAGSNNPVTSSGIAAEISDLNDALSTKVESVNTVLPDTNGNVSLLAEDIPAEGIGYKYAEGNPVVITDGIAEIADDLKVDFGPIQDLHGYDYPWVGGAGKNICVGSPSFNEYNNRDRYQLSEETYNGHEVIYKSEAWKGIYKASTVKANVTYTFSAMVKCADTQVVYVFGKGARQLAVQSIGDTWTRITATFTPTEDTVEEIHVESATSTTIYLSEYQLEVGSAATSFAPYSNICPISGRTQVDVTRTGKNLLENTATTTTLYGVTFTVNDDGTIIANGTSTNNIFLTLGAITKPGTYILSGCPTGGGNTGYSIRTIPGNNRDYGNGVTFTVTDDAPQTLRIVFGGEGEVIANNLIFKPMIRLASESDATFEPYSKQEVTIQLGDTVYGGTLDVTTGTLTVRTANIASYNGETIGEPWWSSMDEYIAGTTPTTGAQVVYTLANPVTVTLTSQQLALLEGYNILTTDGDTLNLRYIGTEASNVQAEIDEFEESTRRLAGSLAMIETSPAKASHAVGDYIILNNQLYKVIAAVSVGETLTVGTNIQYTTIADELLAIFSQLTSRLNA